MFVKDREKGYRRELHCGYPFLGKHLTRVACCPVRDRERTEEPDGVS
jgi:hypothetical protein